MIDNFVNLHAEVSERELKTKTDIILYLIIKSIHIIFVVSYFAGLFYIVRLLIYHTEALQGEEGQERDILHKQYSFMEERLWNIITVPALVIVLVSGIYLLWAFQWMFLTQGWMHIKLLGIVLLLAYHYWSWRTLKELQRGETRYSSVKLRMANEVATLLLFAIVFAVVLKDLFLQYWWATLLSFVAMGALIMAVVKIVNKK